MGEWVEFEAGDQTAVRAYLALPSKEKGAAVLVLHAWWGLNEFFQSLTDRLAAEGFVALAPDLYDGKLAHTIPEAEELLKTLKYPAAMAKLQAAVDLLVAHPAVVSPDLGVIGFSLGGAYASQLSIQRPTEIAAVIIFYGTDQAEFSQARAAYLGHFGETDEWEPEEGVRQLQTDLEQAGRAARFYRYPDTGHWFFEDNRPDAYQPEAAALAWQRSLEFLHINLDPTPAG